MVDCQGVFQSIFLLEGWTIRTHYRMQITPYRLPHPLPATPAPEHRPERYRTAAPSVPEVEPVLQGELIRGAAATDPVREAAQRFRAAAGATPGPGSWSTKALERYATVEQGRGRPVASTSSAIDFYA